MLKLNIIVLCAVLCVQNLDFVFGNGYYGGGGNQQQPQQSNQPQNQNPGNNNMWWLKNNAFQKPPNHPGVERGDQSQTQGQQQKAPRGQNPANQQQTQGPVPECLLRLKSDCHGSSGAQPQNARPQEPANYQFDPLQSYPVYTAFVIPATDPASYSQQPTPYSGQNQPQSSYSGQNQPNPYNSASAGPSNQYNAQPQQPTNTNTNQNFRPNPQGSQPSPQKQPQQSPNYNQVSYRPPVVPYTNPAQSQNNNPQQASQGNTNYEEQPPYPGCPAAMLCVPENYCDSKGVSAGKPLPLSEADKLFRVALMSCSSPSTGEVGVCCRDPDYKDPWPMGMDMNGGGGVQTYDNRQGKGFDDGQYRPSPHFPPNQHHQTHSAQNQEQKQPKPQPYQGSQTSYHTEEINSNPQFNEPSISSHFLQDTLTIDYNTESFYNAAETPSSIDLNTEPFYDAGIITTPSTPTSTSTPSPSPPPPSTESTKGGEDDTILEITKKDDEEGVYRPNPWSYDEEFSDPKPVEAPSQLFQLPSFLPDGSPILHLATIQTNPEDEIDENNFGIRGGFPSRKSFVEVCPNSMKCLRESYCQQPNPNEGFVSDFDVRVSFRKPTKLKCKQDNLPVDGVCCFLREDYMSDVTTRPFSTGISPSPPSPANHACGVRRIKKTNGDDTDETGFGEFPWQALIFGGNNIVCSGAIISDRIILTAASCVSLVHDSQLRVRVGEWDQKTTSETKPFQEFKIAAVITHPNYNPLSMSNNVALLYTQKSISYDYHVGRLCLPQPITSFEGRRCVLTGWGSAKWSRRGNGTSDAGILHKSYLSVLANTDCTESLRSTNLGSTFKLPRPSLCALPEFKQDICVGDEGSPLVCEAVSTGEYILAGFLVGTDWGINCNRPEIPGVFSSVSPLVEWIYGLARQDPESVIQNNQQRNNKNKKY